MLRLLMSFVLVSCARFATAEESSPNIIYILADDLGYGDLGCFGGKVIPTPHLDRMAAEGMKFTRHYAGCTVCAPSRCVLLTGLHMGHCTVRGNSPGTMKPEDVTVAELLKTAGYKTGCIGKWGVGNPPPLDDPARNGFDHFYGYINMFHAHNFYPEFLIRNGKHEPLRNEVAAKWKDADGRGLAVKKVDYAPDLLSEDVLRFLEQHQKDQFFLYYALNIPHANNEASRANTPERGMEVPDFGPFAEKDWPGPEKGFAAMIHKIDQDVGRILAKLKELKLDENTLVIFTSDNGPHQEGGHQMEYFNSNGSLLGMKRDLTDGGIRVPMIARWPGHIAPGSTTDHISGFQDVLSTLAELAGVEVTHSIDGISFLPTLLGKADTQKKHKYLYWEFSERGGKRAVLFGDWKLIQLQVGSPNPPAPKLYRVDAYPSEGQDFAPRHQQLVKQMKRWMDQSHKPNPSYPLFASEKKSSTPKPKP